jgi:hypothetical protein
VQVVGDVDGDGRDDVTAAWVNNGPPRTLVWLAADVAIARGSPGGPGVACRAPRLTSTRSATDRGSWSRPARAGRSSDGRTTWRTCAPGPPTQSPRPSASSYRERAPRRRVR